MAGQEGVEGEEHNAHHVDGSTSPPPPGSNSAGEDESLESSTSRSGPEEGRQGNVAGDGAPPADSDNTAHGEEGLSATFHHFVTDLRHQIANVKSRVLEAAHLDKKQGPDGDKKQTPNSEPVITSRGVEFLSGLTLQRNPRKAFSVADGDPSRDSSSK